MLSQQFNVPVKRLYRSFTEPKQITEWFQADERFTTNYTWGFVCSNGSQHASLAFGKFGEELPLPVAIETLEEKEQLSNFADHSQTPSEGCPVVNAWCQDTDESSSVLWLRSVFANESECQQSASSSYAKFWEEQLEKLATLLPH